MKNNQYQQLALLTESPANKGPLERMRSSITLSCFLSVCRKATAIAEQADNLKRIVFYGREGEAISNLDTKIVEAAIVERLDERDVRLIHASLGMLTEAVEFMQAIELAILGGEPPDKVNLVEEVGDQMWYGAVALDALGFTIEQCQETNIKKLSKRFGHLFSEHDATNRGLGAEREVMEEGLGKKKLLTGE